MASQLCSSNNNTDNYGFLLSDVASQYPGEFPNPANTPRKQDLCTHLLHLRVPHIGTSATLTVGAQLDALLSASDESWAFSDLRIQLDTGPVLQLQTWDDHNEWMVLWVNNTAEDRSITAAYDIALREMSADVALGSLNVAPGKPDLSSIYFANTSWYNVTVPEACSMIF